MISQATAQLYKQYVSELRVIVMDADDEIKWGFTNDQYVFSRHVEDLDQNEYYRWCDIRDRFSSFMSEERAGEIALNLCKVLFNTCLLPQYR